MPRLTHIAETCLYVADLDRSVQFYTTTFGLTALRRDARFCALRIRDDEVLLLFLRGASLMATNLPGGVVPAHDGSGELHICFGISEQDLTAFDQLLTSKNVKIESRVVWPSGATSLYFRDPDNHAVELSTPGVWSK